MRPVLSFKGTKSRYDNIDIITVRENTEGMYPVPARSAAMTTRAPRR